MVPGIGTVVTPLAAGISAGVVFGVLNLLASNWSARRALRFNSEADAIKFMILGFAVRLAVLALAIFAIPRRWMNAEAFVLTFLIAFFVGFVLEARVLFGRKTETAGPKAMAASDTPGGSKIEAEDRTG